MCAVSFTPPPVKSSGDAAIAAAFTDEFGGLLPWYERALDGNGRPTVGASTPDVEALRDYFSALVDTNALPHPIGDFTLADSLRLAAEDLKAFYFEAAAAQPGIPDALRLLHWFWGETHAGGLLRALMVRFETSEDPNLALLGQLLLVPRAVLDSPSGSP